MFNKKNILITGGTGNLGKKFVEILLKNYKPNKIVIYSRNELRQYEMQEEFQSQCMRYLIGDVRDFDRLKLAMKNVDYVIHTATLKNISITEYNPSECIKTNIHGSENIIHAAIENNVKKIISLSATKSVTPSNLYESTILTSDKLFIAANNLVAKELNTQFSVVRYASTFESSEYIESYFQKLINIGIEPKLIENIKRANIFFTLEDGVHFVLKSFERMQGGEMFIPKVSSRKIIELTLTLAKDLRHDVLDIYNHDDETKNNILDINNSNVRIEFDDHYVVQPTLKSKSVDFLKNTIGEKGTPSRNFIPYGKQLIEQDDINSVVNVLKSEYLTTGPRVKEFEDMLSSYCGAKYTVAVSNGTAALHLASLVLLNEGDKVLTTPNSFLATSNSILYVAAKPIFIDITKDGNIDLDLCEEAMKLDPSIKAIYVVAFSGNMINQKKLNYLKNTYNIKILEDCAHAIGAKYGDVNAGSCVNSDCSIFSFHPVKHLTTAEGGAITTNSKEIYDKLMRLRNHGIYKNLIMEPWVYEMKDLGFNYRVTDLQCALGISQLKKLNLFVETRFEIAKKYDYAFQNTIVKPLYTFDGNSSYHLYVVQVEFSKIKINKVELFNYLRDKKIGIQLHYIPINKQPYYKNLGYGNETTPNMDKYYEECFSLPMYPLLKEEEQNYVIQTLLEVLNT